MSSSSHSPTSLPLVVQVGFSGSRRLYPESVTDTDVERFNNAIVEQLQEILQQLSNDLSLSSNHFLCGISQMAIGADMAFAKACSALDIPHRVYLPQHRDAFLEAIGSQGPDFTTEEQEQARELLNEPNIIQERVASHSADRGFRFEETNLEILRISDVMICLRRDDGATTKAVGNSETPTEKKSKPKQGGTREIMDRAKDRVPTLEIRVVVNDGQVELVPTWCCSPEELNTLVKRPELKGELAGFHPTQKLSTSPLPSVDEYCTALKQFGSGIANSYGKFFRWAAVLIILSHALATFISTYGLATHGQHNAGVVQVDHGDHSNDGIAHAPVSTTPDEAKDETNDQKVHSSEVQEQLARDTQSHQTEHSGFQVILIIVELGLLVFGFAFHRYLHTSHAGGNWAFARLLAEINRSMPILKDVPTYLEYLFRLPLPNRLRSVLRTINVLHLRTSKSGQKPLHEVQQNYLKRVRGQIAFYGPRIEAAQRQRNFATLLFTLCSLGAIVMVIAELFFSYTTIAMFAALLPAFAVSVASLAAAADLDAIIETYSENLAFLVAQEPLLKDADSKQELIPLILETEARLLGETANWYSRRAFLGIV